MKIGFAIITEDPFFSDVINITNGLSKEYAFLNDLGNIHNLPHTTLFQGDFDDSIDYENILKLIVEKINMLDITYLNFENVVYVPEGWYFYICRNEEKLQELHNFVLDKIKDKIILSPNRLKRNISNLTKDQYDGIEKYGYRYSGNAFYPHITLARTSENEDPILIRKFQDKLNPLDKKVAIKRVTVYTMGENGTHKDTLASIDL